MVGKGAFGKVRIVERKDTGLTFALKYIRKDEGRFLEGNTGRRHNDLHQSQLSDRRVFEISFENGECWNIWTILFSATCDIVFRISSTCMTPDAVGMKVELTA